MVTISEKQVAKLLEDIASIKSVLHENRPVLKQLLLPIHFRFVSFFAGAGIILFPVIYYFLLQKYGSYDDIPGQIRNSLIVVVLIYYFITLFLKRLLWVKSVKQIDSRFNFGTIIKNLYSYQIMHFWIPLLLTMLFLSRAIGKHKTAICI